LLARIQNRSSRLKVTTTPCRSSSVIAVWPNISTWLRCIAANLGSALNPLLEGTAGGDPAAGRVPAGNLLNRLVGIALVLALVNRIGPLMVSIEADAGRVVADFHTVFNLVMAILFLPLLRPFTRMLVWLLPARAASTDPSQPIYLSEAAREPPCPCGCGTGGAPHG
jgi:phosphate:Na+ symporter